MDVIINNITFVFKASESTIDHNLIEPVDNEILELIIEIDSMLVSIYDVKELDNDVKLKTAVVIQLEVYKGLLTIEFPDVLQLIYKKKERKGFYKHWVINISDLREIN